MWMKCPACFGKGFVYVGTSTTHKIGCNRCRSSGEIWIPRRWGNGIRQGVPGRVLVVRGWRDDTASKSAAFLRILAKMERLASCNARQSRGLATAGAGPAEPRKRMCPVGRLEWTMTMEENKPLDPNQVLCLCGRLVRVFSSFVNPDGISIVDCTFTVADLCEECRAAHVR